MLVSCTKASRNIDNHSQKDFDYLLHQKLLSVDSILEKKKEVQKILYIYNFYDCESCINKGFTWCKKIHEYCKNLYIITSDTQAYRDQYRNKYYEYIYYDERDRIRRELKFVPTPIFVFLDQNNMISYYFQVLPESSDENLQELFKYIKRHNYK